MRLVILTALAFLLCGPAALCQSEDNDLNASELRNMVINSSTGLETYRFSMQMDQKIDLVNQSTGEVQTVNVNSLGRGAADMTNRTLKLSMASLAYTAGSEQNTSAIALEEYVINDTIFLKMDGKWQSMKISDDSDLWSQQNTTEQIELFNNTSLTIIGTETVSGQECYKIAAKIDVAPAMDMITEKYDSLAPLAMLNLSSLFGEMNLDLYYWIAKDTHNVLKTDIMGDIVIDPQSMGLSGDSEKMNISCQISMLFEGFNESVNIQLPLEAIQAQASAMDTPLSSPGNDTQDAMLSNPNVNESGPGETDAPGNESEV